MVCLVLLPLFHAVLGAIVLAKALAPLVIELRVAPLACASAAVRSARLLLPLSIGLLPAAPGSWSLSRRTFASQLFNKHVHCIERILVAPFHLAGPRAGNIERLQATLTDEIGDQFCGLARLSFSAIDQLVRLCQLNAIVKRALRAAFDLPKINDGCAITVEHVLPGPVPVVAALDFLHRILFRDRTVFCEPTLRTPASALNIQFQCCIEGAAVYTGLPSRNNLDSIH